MPPDSEVNGTRRAHRARGVSSLMSLRCGRDDEGESAIDFRAAKVEERRWRTRENPAIVGACESDNRAYPTLGGAKVEPRESQANRQQLAAAQVDPGFQRILRVALPPSAGFCNTYRA